MAQGDTRARVRFVIRSLRRSRRPRRVLVAILSTIAVMIALVGGITSPATAKPAAPPFANDPSIAVKAVTSHYVKPRQSPSWKAAATSWPSGAADVALATSASASSPPSPATPQLVTAPVQAGKLPVWVAPAPAAKANTTQTPTAQQTPATVHVSVASRPAAQAVGVTGTIVGVQRTDTATSAGSVQVSIGYGSFLNAYGGEFATRLHLVALPACALTTPKNPVCRTQTPVPFTRDGKADQLTATVALPTATKAKTAAPTMLLAATSGTSGSGGTYSATSLKPEGSWQAGGATDSFSWSYPIPTPNVPGGLRPKVQLSYDSQSADGLTSSTNNQASWIGDGWAYSPGFVERSFQSCGQNPSGPTHTGDNCWSANDTLSLSLNGQSSSLVYDDATKIWHPQSDSDEQVSDVASSPVSNGAQNGEYFVVTTDGGTKYYFGRNQLPGYQSGGSDPTTNSVWTEPVYAPSAGQPCYNATFASSWCQQAYRWNLDYVVDTHGDTISYFYNTESNNYSADNGKNATAGYIRGGYLTKIQYGQRDGHVYDTPPAGQVVFTSTGRCQSAPCDPATISSSTASNWPDVPQDLMCAYQAACDSTSPAFWTDETLQKIETDALVGTTETPVDSWTLQHSFPATNDATTPALWLDSIQHSGLDTTAGGSSSQIDLPAVVFTGANLTNRVNLANGVSPLTRQRLVKVTTETGEEIQVDYSAPACGQGTPSDASQNTSLCYPDYWSAALDSPPTIDWFNKFIVTHVTEVDPTGGGGNDTIVTTYTPVGDPAWHQNLDPLTPSDQRTWDDWRGYQGMTVTTGTGPDPQTKTVSTYFRGMNGDAVTGGTRSVSVRDSKDDSTTDLPQYEGMTYESVVYNGSSIVTDTITDPWSSAATATHAVTGLPAEQAFLTGTADTRVYTPLANDTTRRTETSNTYDSYGRVTQVNDQGDLSTTTDDLCTTTTYNDNTSAGILDTPSEVKTVSVNCATTATAVDLVSDAETFYDGATSLGTAPTIGDPTEVQKAISATGSTENWATTSETVDEYGRPLTATDADSRITKTTYTPATGAEPTSTSATDPMGHVTSTTSDPLRGLTLTSTDAAGFVTKQQYDALGRLTSVSKPGISGASLKYSYTVSNTGPSVVDTYTLNPDGSYRLAETLYDAMLRARETQTQTPDNGRDIADTDYNTDGWESRSTDPYFNTSPVSTTYVQAQDGTVPSETGYTYDGAGRKTAAISYTNGTTTETPTWQTNYVYGGDYTTTVPPAGATATTTITDARGNTTDLIQYHTGVPTDPSDPAADYADTRYTYTPAQKMATVTDAAGNSWSYGYNLLGDQTSASDPDAGASSSVYDPAGQLSSVTDARGKQTSTTYDKDGRKTATYDTTGGAAETQATKLAGWTYDNTPILVSGKKAVGYPSTTVSYNGGDTYTQTINDYDSAANAAKSTTTLAGQDAALVPSAGFTDQDVYSTTGYLTDDYQSAIDGLPQEDTQTAYADVTGATDFGEPDGLSANPFGAPGNTIASAVGYTELGQVAQYSLSGAPNSLYLNYGYDSQTQALTDIKAGETGQPGDTGTLDDLTYRYSGPGVSAGAGLVTATIDSQNAGATVDTQCFAYDYAQRLSQAWTATDSCTATPASGNSATVGGPQPYWQSWTYDAAGDRATETDHDPNGTTSNDTTTTYNYPTPGSATDQPHTLTSTTATGPQAAQNTASFGYDTDGNTHSITTGANGAGDQTLTYNDQGKLASDVTVSGNTTYVYDASGNLLVRRDPGTTTLLLGNQQLTQNTATGALSGTRYYSINGSAIAARTGGADPQILVPDRQGTDQVSLNPDNDALTRRQFLPFGQTRGLTPTTWAGGDTGYVGGTPDATTSLENLGAREYDPTTGRFLTIDPTFEANDPTQIGGYDYAGNNPVTRDDPTGLHPADCGPSDGCLQGYENSVQAGMKASHYGLIPPSPEAAKAIIETAAYEALQDKIAQLEAQLAQFKAQYQDHMEECFLGENKRVMPVDTSGCGYPAASWQDIAVFAGVVGGAAACLLPVVDVACGVLAEAELGGGVTAMGGLGVAAAAGGEAAITLTDLIGADTKALDDAQAASDALTACGNSFVGSTPVLMADGRTKPIDQIKVGDKITNAQAGGKAPQNDVVTAVHVTYTDRDYDRLTVADGRGSGTITSTAGHLFWDATTRSWTEADNLNVGDELDGVNGGSVKVLSTHHYRSLGTTYNLTVKSVHTYYVVGGAVSVLVHNGCGGVTIGLGKSAYGLEDKANNDGAWNLMSLPDWKSFLGDAIAETKNTDSDITFRVYMDGISPDRLRLPADATLEQRVNAMADLGDRNIGGATAIELSMLRSGGMFPNNTVFVEGGNELPNPFAGR